MTGSLTYPGFVGGVVVVAASDFLKSVRTLVVVPILAKVLGPEAYGVWVQVKVTAAFLGPLALLGLGDSMVRFLGREQHVRDVRRGFNSSVCAVTGAGAIVALILWLHAEALAELIFQGPGAAHFVRITAVLVLLDAVDRLAAAYLQAVRRMLLHSSITALEVLVEVAVVAALALTGTGVSGILMALVGWKGVVVLGKLARIWSEIGWSVPALSVLKSYVAFGLPLAVAGLCWIVANSGDRYLIKLFLGIREVGIYSVAYTMGSLPFILMTPIDYVLFPTIAEFWRSGRREEVERYIQYSVKYALLVAIPVVFCFAVLSEELIVTFATPEFAGVRVSVTLIALGFVLLGIGVVGQRVILLANRPHVISGLYASLAGLNILLNLVLIPAFGSVGAAVATLVTFGSYSLFTVGFARAYCEISVEREALGKSVLASVAMAAVLAWLDVSSGVALAGALLAGGGVYVVVLWLVRVLSPQEVGAAREVISAVLRGKAFVKAA